VTPASERIKSIGVITLGIYAFGVVIGWNALDALRIFDVELGLPWWVYALAPIPLGVLFFWAVIQYTEWSVRKKRHG
jgi:hypothetical protein